MLWQRRLKVDRAVVQGTVVSQRSLCGLGDQFAGAAPYTATKFTVEALPLIGRPLTVGGPVDQVQVFVPVSALAGAAVGTAVLPGVDTAVGARIGSVIDELFGSGPAAIQDAARAGN